MIYNGIVTRLRKSDQSRKTSRTYIQEHGYASLFLPTATFAALLKH